MLRAFCALFSSLILSASVSGCSALVPPKRQSEQSEQPSGSATYYNSYLDLVVTIPDGWYEEDVNIHNLTENPRGTGDLSSLDLYEYGDGGYSIELITIQNYSDSSSDGHAELILFADYYPGTAEDEYLSWMSEYIEEQTNDEYLYELEDVGAKTVNGRMYTRFLAKVSFFDGAKPYYEEYYISPVNETFFVAYINYWSGSKKSKDAAYTVLENAFSLGGAYGAETHGLIESL